MSVQIGADERRMLQELADREGLSASAYVRQLIRRQHAEVFGKPAPKRAKRK